MKNVSRQTLYPGCYFIDRRVSESSNWSQLYYDNDQQVMLTRMTYARETRAAGEQFRLVDPAGNVVEIAGLEV